MINRIDVVSIPVSDQDRAKAFYRDMLAFIELSDTQMGDGMRWVQLSPPGSSNSVTLVTWFDTMPAGSLRGLVLTRRAWMPTLKSSSAGECRYRRSKNNHGHGS